jgi:YVTN family beta-propeller protein
MKVLNQHPLPALGAVVLGIVVGAAACGDAGAHEKDHQELEDPRRAALMNRAYIVSLESDELTVIDLDRLEIIARVPTGGSENHMAELNADYTRIYVDSSHSDETVVVDLEQLAVVKRIPTGKHPTHLSLHGPSGLLSVMLEGDNAISFLDTHSDEIIKTLPGFMTPHHARYSPDGKWAYVANIGAHHITRLDMETLEIVGNIALDGFAENMPTGGEGGFADVQIDRTGVLHAAHGNTGRVMMVDVATGQKIAETNVGRAPWIVYAEHPFDNVPLTHLVPNFGDRTVSMIAKSRQVGTVAGDQESYGVNYTSLDPDVAYVMNRMREDIALVDVAKGELLERIPVGGNTETASTTPDGRYIVAAVSGANRVVVLDAATRSVKKIFENVGKYPWSVTIPGGQNYCH